MCPNFSTSNTWTQEVSCPSDTIEVRDEHSSLQYPADASSNFPVQGMEISAVGVDACLRSISAYANRLRLLHRH